jgi:uncharacterized protein (TIGR01777 family)
MSEEPFKVVLSGASGMLGTALRAALAERRTPALQLVRGTPASRDQLAWNPAAEPALANPAGLEGFGAAIHLSGVSVRQRWTAAYKQEMATSRVKSTQTVARLLAGLHRPPKTLLVASAVGFYGNRGEELLDESSPAGAGYIAQLCREWEAAAKPAADAGIRVVNLRFGVVLGQGGGALAPMLPVFRLGLGARLGTGRQWMPWISLGDGIGAILFAMDTPGLAGPVNLTAPNPVRNAEFTRALGRQLKRPAVFRVPAMALRLAFGEMADEMLLASERAVPERLTSAGFRFKHPTVEQALAAALG